MGKIASEFKAIGVYIKEIFKITFNKSITSSQQILTYVYLFTCFVLYLINLLLPDTTTRYLPLLEKIMNYNWWGISLMALGGLLVLRILLSPYIAYKNAYNTNVALKQQIADVQQQNNIFEETIREVRKEIQDKSGFQLIDIPEILNEINQIAAKIGYEREKSEVPADVMLSIFLDLLDIDENDPIVRPKNYKNLDKNKISHFVKTFRVRMGIKKNNSEKARLWARNIITLMNDRSIGLNLKANDEFMMLYERLNKYRVHISGVKLNASIDNYLFHLEGLWDIRLMSKYTDSSKLIHLFPDNAKQLFDEIETMETGIMVRELAIVNNPLERWLGGATE